MTTNAYHRAVRDYLRDGYGVRVTVSVGGSHKYLAFDYGGKPRRITLHTDTRETNALAMKLQDIRRELGPPRLIEIIKTKRRLEDMTMPEPFNPIPLASLHVDPNATTIKPSVHARGTVACYASNKCLTFSFPHEILARLDRTKKYRVMRHGDGWEICPGGHCRVQTQSKHLWGITASVKSNDLSPSGSFGATPADYVAVDGSLLVSLVEPTRTVSERFNRRKTKNKSVPVAPPVRLIEPPQLVLAEKPIVNLEYATDYAAKLEILRRIRAIERTEWRLHKVNGKWTFRVPEVTLEDE